MPSRDPTERQEGADRKRQNRRAQLAQDYQRLPRVQGKTIGLFKSGRCAHLAWEDGLHVSNEHLSQGFGNVIRGTNVPSTIN